MKAIEKRCYALTQEIVVKRDKFCVRCCATPISGHHVFGRGNHGSCFEPDSCLGLCQDCHDRWARRDPKDCHDLLREKIGEESYTWLEALSRESVRLREKDFQEIAKGLKELLERMK